VGGSGNGVVNVDPRGLDQALMQAGVYHPTTIVPENGMPGTMAGHLDYG
jgi:hypothetical protein